MYVYIYIYICIYMYTYTHMYMYIYIYTSIRFVSVSTFGKGLMGSALVGSLQISCFWQRDFLVTPVNLLYLPKSARACLFPQSDKNHYLCSGPISVEPHLSATKARPRHRWNRNPRPQPQKFSKLVFLV